MRPRVVLVVVAAAWLAGWGATEAGAARAPGFGRTANPTSGWKAPGSSSRPIAPEGTLALPLAAPWVEAPRLPLERRESANGDATAGNGTEPAVFTSERARILLRSLSVPGWGQATAGRRTSAGLFALAEAGVWVSFTAFKIQQQMRKESYERTARLLAGIDLSGRDEEFRRIVGAFISSDEYNQLVVYRDAANLYYFDPVKYREYIAEHELKGADTWEWKSEEDFLRYRSQRKREQRSGLKANTALALAIINRLASAVHAARVAGLQESESSGRSWNLELAPTDDEDATAFRLGVRARF